ncbi:nucleotide sugar dehydrogenase [Rhodococcus rhodochrous]|uniref:nucleotide sugar dehydrogenase n=1 Tax=Rhodococcus rhodochrous TaxID=1829 RepID=UPI00177D96D5|nr:nucleotide sugar dehydrogenase [Rhodococcus rhodochrous]QOH58101.1 nucleotide sugar dehydrogenase [Rhodococcus rhodochrous]
MNASKPKKVVVIGQGYVGLPVAVRAAEVGYEVVGIDIDPRRVESLQAGKSYVEDVSSERLRRVLESQNYRPSSSYEAAEGFDYAVVSVPTPLRETLPDLTFIELSARDLMVHVSPGCTVILESTTYPGTTEELMVPILEEGSGLRAGEDFFVGYSPERIDPGNPSYGFVETPKVVSGINDESLQRVNEFFGSLIETTVPVSGTREAELTKLLENTFRHVNIALVNELAVFAHQLGIDIWEAIDAAASKPFGFMRFTPGPGVGGHCLPVDPSYLSWQVRRRLGQNFRFVELANDVNDQMPSYVVQRATDLLNDACKSVRGASILLVGLSYKKGTGDVRESPALKVASLLLERGANVAGVDPFVDEARWPEGVTRTGLSESSARGWDLAIVITDHDELDLEILTQRGYPVLDTRNVVVGPSVVKL